MSLTSHPSQTISLLKSYHTRIVVMKATTALVILFGPWQRAFADVDVVIFNAGDVTTLELNRVVHC